VFRRHDGQLSWEGAGQTNLKRLWIRRRDRFSVVHFVARLVTAGMDIQPRPRRNEGVMGTDKGSDFQGDRIREEFSGRITPFTKCAS
jgi:hypothetical protein